MSTFSALQIRIHPCTLSFVQSLFSSICIPSVLCNLPPLNVPFLSIYTHIYIYTYTMSTIDCQNVNVSCFEPQVTETSTTVIKLKVAAAPQPQLTNLEFSNWGSCYQSFSSNPTNCKEFLENESFYTHPFDKKSSFSRLLSQKSLELCTENLGSETGATDIISDDGSIFSSSPASSTASSSSSESFNQENSSAHNNNGEDELRSRYKSKSRNHERFNSSRKFPPPLTTMSGSSSLQVRRHREGGRLIIEAIETPFRNSYLQAERSDGRLRLCYFIDSESDSDLDTAAAPNTEEEEMEEPRNGFESGKEEFDVEKFQRLSRCKERRHENEGLCGSDWKPTTFWVATS